MLRHGLSLGRLISIDDIDDVSWGAKCGCVCPDPKCGEPLIAKSREFEGRKQQKYFAHASGSDCPGAAESALHQLAKQVLADEMCVMVPPVTITKLDASTTLTSLDEGRVLWFDEVRVEAAANGLRPDLVCVSSGRTYMVEILVTHEVDARKRERASQADWTILEIDLSDLLRQPFTAEMVRERLLESDDYRTWIRHSEAVRIALRLDAMGARVEGDCPAGLGKVVSGLKRITATSSPDYAPCSRCPSCYGIDAGKVVCLWPAGVFAASDIATLDAGRSTTPPRFFAEAAELKLRVETQRRAQAEARARQLRIGTEVSVAEGPLPPIDFDALQSALHGASSRLLAAYKKDDTKPIRYLIHLIAQRPQHEAERALLTFHVGPDAVWQVSTGQRPRDLNTGVGYVYPNGDSYTVYFCPQPAPDEDDLLWARRTGAHRR